MRTTWFGVPQWLSIGPHHIGPTVIDYERGLYVVIEQLQKGPAPFPLAHGFCGGVAYRVLGI